MNVPPNVRPFSLELAQQNHPLVTRAGQEAKFIAYVPDAISSEKLIILIDKGIYVYYETGTQGGADYKPHDLFLAPLGYCAAKPVFAGDILIGRIIKEEFTAVVGDINFDGCKWPSKAPVVETRMTDEDMLSTVPPHESWKYVEGIQFTYILKNMKILANKTIERAILDGDVVPTKEVYRLLDEVKMRYDSGAGRNESYYSAVESVMDDYLESL